MLNRPEAVKVAANKLATLRRLNDCGVPVPDFTTNRETAMLWMEEGYRVVCRHKLSAHTGEGIQIIQPYEDLPYAPLYTKYTKKDKEYRVHVFQGRILDLTEKRKRTGLPVTNNLIRNHANGWVFCRDGVYPSDAVKNASIAAVRALGLDFGAVDIIERGEKVYVLEVNTAPGVENTTLDKYVDAFRRLTNGNYR